MKYQDAIYKMVKEIFVVEKDEGYREYYYYLLNKILQGKKTIAIPVRLAKIDEQRFIEEYLDIDVLFTEIDEDGSMKRECQSNGQVTISIYDKGEWFVIAAGQI